MRNIPLLLAVTAFFFSCNKEKNYATVNLDFQTSLNGSDFNPTNTFTDSQSREIKIELIKFYLGNITFVKTNGDEVLAEEIALVELNQDGFGSVQIKVRNGKYDKIILGIGVPDNLNESDPSNFNEEDHPLNTLQNTYWGMNAMYRFVMFDGRYDLEPDQTYDGIFSYHSGYSSSYRTIELDGDFEFRKKESYVLAFNIEVDEILEGAGGTLDIINEANYHGDEANQHLANTLSDNFAACIHLKE